MYGFDKNNSNPVGCVPLDTTLIGKALTIGFLLTNFKFLYNVILGRDWAIFMEAMPSYRN